jgi:hypothetical protein
MTLRQKQILLSRYRALENALGHKDAVKSLERDIRKGKVIRAPRDAREEEWCDDLSWEEEKQVCDAFVRLQDAISRRADKRQQRQR